MTWLMLFGLAMVTFANRYFFFSDSIKLTLGARARRFLRYSSYAVLTAIWVPIVVQARYQPLGFEPAGWDYLIAAVLAGILTIGRVPSMVVVVVSSAVFFCLRFFWL